MLPSKKHNRAQIHSLPREWPELDLTFTAAIFDIRESPSYQDLVDFGAGWAAMTSKMAPQAIWPP